MMRTASLFLAAFLVAIGSLNIQAQDTLFQAPHGPNDTWNLYELGEIELTWAEALDEAQSQTRMGVTGDLASIHSLEENITVHEIGKLNESGIQHVWIGLTDREFAAPIVEQHGAISPQESGGQLGLNCCGAAASKLQGWAWTSGEQFSFQLWNGGEPLGGDVVHIWDGGDWNDADSGFFEDEPEEAILLPGTSTDELGGPALPFVIEYRTQAMNPFPDVPIFDPPEVEPPPVNALTATVDTFLAESEFAQLGPDGSHGTFREWEWDGSDGAPEPGQNQGLLYFDIPENILSRFGDGTATLVLQVSNDGDNGDVHRVTVDWLSGPDGGDNVTYNNMPGGPGLFPGDNLEEDFSFFTDPLPIGEFEFDVTEDVLAWATGVPNYGWGFIPTGGGGTGIRSSESGRGPLLILELEVDAPPGDFDGDGDLDIDDINRLNAEVASNINDTVFDLTGDSLVNMDDIKFWVNDLKNTWVGDANLDGEFNSSDLVAVFQPGKFEQNEDATWDQGDWTGDLRFGTPDLVAAFQQGGFEQGPRNAVAAVPEPSGLLLLGVALLAMCGLRRNHNRVFP